MAPAPSEESASSGTGQRRAVGDDADAELPAVPCHIFLPVVPAARVIGKGGSSIRAIREQSGADVRVLQKELPREMQRREDRIVVIAGGSASVREAIRAVLERVFDRSGLPYAQARAAGGGSADRPYIVEAVVPEKSSAHLVGQRGERIQSLIEETHCDLHVVKESMMGLIDQKRVRVTGTSSEDVADAIWRLQEVLAELTAGGVLRPEHFELRVAGDGFNEGGGSLMSTRAPSRGPGDRDRDRERETPIRILVSKEEAAWIVGKRGHKITRLRDFAKVHMNDVDSPPFDASERVVEVSTAPLEHRLKVVQMLTDDLKLRPDAPDELRLLVPTDHFGSVMGHRGETIRGIMQSTGASLQQHKAERSQDGSDYRLRLVEVRGDARQRVEAVRQVHMALEKKSGTGAAVDANGGYNGAGSRVLASELGLGLSSTAVAGLDFGSGGAAGAVGRMHGRSGFGLDRLGASLGGATGLRDLSGNASDADPTSHLSLQLKMPSDEVARMLASESSGIAWRAGVRLSAGRGASEMPILEVQGTAVGNAVACYLIQDRLFMMH